MAGEARFVSEPIEPRGGRRDAGAMARGEPGLPAAFSWRGTERRVAEILRRGRGTGTDMGEVYVRRHTYRLRMDDGSAWEVYFLRQPPAGRRAAKPARWYLLTVEPPEA